MIDRRNRFVFPAMAVLAVLIMMAARSASADEGIAKPVFSRESGFWQDSFMLEITCPEGCEVYYTLDCSDPAVSRTARLCTGPVEIKNSRSITRFASVQDISLNGYNLPDRVDKGIVVRAVCRDGNGNCSEEVNSIYFIGKKKPYYFTMKVISLITDYENLFDRDTGIYMVGNGYYAWRNSSLYEEYDDPADTRYPTNYNMHGREWERECSVQVFDAGSAVYSQKMGMRISGGFSRAAAQKSITLYARKEYSPGIRRIRYDFFDGRCRDAEGNTITTFDRVTLRNGGNDIWFARFRDDINHALFEGMDFGTLSKADAILFINGEFWGYYSLQEKPGSSYAADHYHVDRDGITVIKNGNLDDGSEEIFTEWQEYYSRAVHADFSYASVYEDFCSRVDVDSLIDLFIAESYICNWDFAINVNNWMMWRVNEPGDGKWEDGKWRFIIFDTEFSEGLYENEETDLKYGYLSKMSRDTAGCAWPALIYRLIKNPDFCERFYSRYLEEAQNRFAPEKAETLVRERQDTIHGAYSDTVARFGGWDIMANEAERVIDFFAGRGLYAIRDLESFCGKKKVSVTLFKGSKGWEMYTKDPAEAEMVRKEGNTTRFTLNITQNGAEAGSVQVSHPFVMEKGKNYTFTFRCETDAGHPVALCIANGDATVYCLEEYTIPASGKSVSCTLCAPEDDASAAVSILCGAEAGEYRFSMLNMTVEK